VKGTLFCYRATMVTSAVLLFAVQPMIGKMVLPRLGGTPAVWTTCMLFFQAILLAGYAYAHGSIRWLGVRRQMIPHGALLLAPLCFGLLPLALPGDWSSPGDAYPAVWLLALLLAAAGAPVFMVSSTAPLIQRWFAETSHPTAGDPYYLYSASNAGSMAALLGYPVVVEPLLSLPQQTRLWSAGYVILIGLCAACGWMVWRSKPDETTPRVSHAARAARAGRESSKSASTGERLLWIALALVPCSWMLAVTAYITTDIAPVPLLWIVPLALYLLSFILVFARRPPIPHRWIVRVFPLTLIPLAVSIIVADTWTKIVIHLAAFFVGALVCHGELARRRPPVARLTEFYLWMSVGGAAGGVFNALIAPALFPVLLEFPLVVTAACLLVPRTAEKPNRATDLLALLIVLLLIAPMLTSIEPDRAPTLLRVATLLVGVPLLIVTTYFRRPVWFAAVLAAVFTVDQFDAPMPGVELLETRRSFFGVHRVVVDGPRPAELGSPPPRFRRLLHGTTQHGFQHVDPSLACRPLAYYHPDGPLGDIFAALPPPSPAGASPQQIAIVGLGTGAAVCYAAPGRRITFYEIDPVVRQLALDRRFFTYLSDCGQNRYEVILGDGRLALAEAGDAQYDMILLDAFSSDAVPVHLLTRDAVSLYTSKLAAGGVLAFHVSNNHLDLTGPLSDVAADAGLLCLVCRDLMQSPSEAAQMLEGRAPSTYVVMARDEDHLRPLMNIARWRKTAGHPDARVWTDDFSNIVSALDWTVD